MRELDRQERMREPGSIRVPFDPFRIADHAQALLLTK